MAVPAPQVVVATSVESKFKVTVVVVPESETTVSMPLVPPTISRRSPATKVVSVPVSAPTSKSVVSVSASVPQVKTLATVSRAVQVVKEESPKVTEELSKRRAPSTSNVPSIYASSPFRETVGAALPTLRLPVKTLKRPAAERVSVIEPSPWTVVTSVPPEASKTQLMAVPAPQVVVATSVESKFKVTVVVVPESETTVSMPLVPPTISRRSPATKVVSVPVSAPTSKSVVSVSASVPQVKTLATVSRAVQVVKEESPKVTEELSKRRAPSTSNVPSIYASSPFRETVGAALPTLRLPPKTLNNPAAERVSVIEPSP